MIDDPTGTVLAIFAAFCRIGACLMVMPGFSSFRIALQIRLFAAVALSIALLPLLWDTIYPRVQGGGASFIYIIGVEIFIGAFIGLLARMVVLSMQFAGTAISVAIGMNGQPGAPIIENEPEGQLTAFITFTALLLLFMADFHHLVIETLVRSYEFLPMGGAFGAQRALVSLTDTLSSTFVAVLRLAAPFIVYGLVFNFSIGMVNKLAPQIPLYFISIPFLLAGGLILFYFGSTNFFTLFSASFGPLFEGLR